jgi:hypothetical protein
LWLPSLTQWLWLMMLLLLLTKPWRTVMVSADGDACFHWRVGEYMLEQRQIIRQEVFSYTRFGAPLISKEWLSEIVFAAAGRLGGLTGLGTLAALVIATTFALLHRQLIREGNDLLTATLVLVVAMWAATSHWLARPHVFSFLFMVLWHDRLRRHRRVAQLSRLVGGLSVLTLLWVNIHGGYLAACFVLAAYWLGALFEQDLTRLKHLTIAAAACGVAALVNPNGLRLHLHNLAFLRSNFFTGWLAEYQTLNFQSAGSHGFLLWLALLFLTLGMTRPRWRPTEILLVTMWGYFALFAGRNVALFALLSAPLIAPPISEFVSRRWRGLCQRLAETDAAANGWPVVVGIALAAIVLVPRPTSLPAKDWPIAAVAHVRAHAELFPGHVFNQYKWGGYFLQFVPEYKVFVDGRADFYGEELVREFDHVTALRPGWQDILAKYDVQWTLMPVDHPLNVALHLLPDWQPAYADDVAAIYRRVAPAAPTAATEAVAPGDAKDAAP